MQTVIAVTNQKGGVGKTTTAVNLSAFLAQMGQRVLLVDLDPQGNTTSGTGIDKRVLERSIYSALHQPKAIDGVIKPTEHGFSVLPAHPELAAAEVELVSLEDREQRLKQILAQTDFDYVIIDCPPSLGLLTINALTAADHILIPVQAEYFALEGLGQLLETTQLVQKALNPQLNLLGVVMTMHDHRTTLSSQVGDEVRRHFPGKVFDAVIPRNVRLAEAPSSGKPAHAHDRWSKGAKAYKKLAKQVHEKAK